MLNPMTTSSVPRILPKRKPPTSAIGDPKPRKGNTHKIVTNKKNIDNKKRLEFFNSKKKSLLFLMTSKLVKLLISSMLNLDKKNIKNIDIIRK